VTGKHPDLPVLFVSAHPARELIQRGQVPADALLLQKPFDPTLLAAALRDLFERRASAAPPATVLLVDDSEAALSILRDYLRSRGYRVLAAPDAQQALALADEHAIDALVTDFALRETTGTALAARLRESRPELPVVLVSGSAEVEVPPRGRFLQKPFQLERLDQELKDAISER
jgi:two-component system cell cycle sensor histidine kinase/response regulator CckA